MIGVLNHLEDCTKPCLEAIKKYTDLSNVEVIVVANGCTDGTEDYVRSLGEPFKLLVHPEPMGYAGANNWGISEAKGDYIVLLNNDAFLAEQPKNQWLEMLEAPFKTDPKMGITGPMRGHSDPGGRDFLVFFCVMICRELIDKLKLSMDYGVGGGEDTEYVYEAEKLGYHTAEVPEGGKVLEPSQNFFVGGFPIWHAGEKTVYDNPDWKKIFDANSLTLAKKYNHAWYRWKLGSNFERAVLFKDDDINPTSFEYLRYTWAAQNLKGKKVLEFGCSSGFSLKFLPEDVEYTGVDYNETIIGVAQKEFGNDKRKFIHCDANKFEFKEHYDTIIAFEFLEHISNGKEFAQKLKQHCDVLLCSTPYKEAPGTWGEHHLLHRLSQKDFPNFEYIFINDTGHLVGRIHKDPSPGVLNLMLMKWEKGKTYEIVEEKPTVLAFIPTKNRYNSLAMTIQSIAMQTHKPDHLIIYDDGEGRDLRNDPIFKYVFRLLDLKDIKWEVIFGRKLGQHHGHEIANTQDYTYVWRIDDDEIAEPDVLEKLLSLIQDPTVGAVGGAVVIPGEEASGGSSKIEDIYSSPNLQWSRTNKATEVDHLYSSFLYRAGVVHYELNLSPVAHREETIFTLRLKDKGYRLLFAPDAVTYHFRHDTGGIRDNAKQDFFVHDETIFKLNLESMGIKVIRENGGLGDNLVFKNNALFPLLKKYKRIILGTCYPNVFQDVSAPNLTILPVGIIPEVPTDNIYAWASNVKWDKSFGEAYKKFYGVEQ